LLAAGLALGGWLTAGALPDAWDWQPGLAFSEPWRWWSAAWVHWGDTHLRMNLAACALLGWLGWRARLGPGAALAWSLAWPLSSLALLAQPSLLHYGGLSGVLHAGVVIVAWALLQRLGRDRLLGGLMAAGLVLKLCAEQPWAGTLQPMPGAGFSLAPGAHLAGVAAGVFAVCIGEAIRRVHAKTRASRLAPIPPTPH
jgi:rhomboid family GlyGly-CTERM serine protease